MWETGQISGQTFQAVGSQVAGRSLAEKQQPKKTSRKLTGYMIERGGIHLIGLNLEVPLYSESLPNVSENLLFHKFTD